MKNKHMNLFPLIFLIFFMASCESNTKMIALEKKMDSLHAKEMETLNRLNRNILLSAPNADIKKILMAATEDDICKDISKKIKNCVAEEIHQICKDEYDKYKKAFFGDKNDNAPEVSYSYKEIEDVIGNNCVGNVLHFIHLDTSKKNDNSDLRKDNNTNDIECVARDVNTNYMRSFTVALLKSIKINRELAETDKYYFTKCISKNGKAGIEFYVKKGGNIIAYYDVVDAFPIHGCFDCKASD